MDPNFTSERTKIRYKDYGILILRLGIGFILLFKIFFLKSQLENSEILSSALILAIILADFAFIVGYYTRFVAAFLALTFMINFAYDFFYVGIFSEFSNDLMISVIFFACIYLGGGKLSIDYKDNHYKVSIEGTGAF